MALRLDNEKKGTLKFDKPKKGLAAKGLAVAEEVTAGLPRGLANTVNFFGTEPANYLLRKAGVDYQIPDVSEALRESTGLGQGGYMEPGLGRDVAATAGEWIPAIAGLARNAAVAAKDAPKTINSLLDDFVSPKGAVKPSGVTPAVTRKTPEIAAPKNPAQAASIYRGDVETVSESAEPGRNFFQKNKTFLVVHASYLGLRRKT